MIGTAGYMSQVQGHPIDKRTDIWAFGVVLLESRANERSAERRSARPWRQSDEIRTGRGCRAAPPLVIRKLLKRCQAA